MYDLAWSLSPNNSVELTESNYKTIEGEKI
jgi:hypothetical protein